MKRTTFITTAGLLAFLVAGLWWQQRRETAVIRSAMANSGAESVKPADPRIRADRPPASNSPRVLPVARELSAAEKAARVEKIKRDYDELRAKAAADYSAAGARFPGGLNAYLRQLALLEREKRADLAATLSAAELEDLELRESTAGQLVTRLLGDTAATEAQRRAVFRLQQAFEERFALTFDASPRATLERELSRQAVQEQIRAVLGDALFASWLRGEGADFANAMRFVTAQGLPETRAFELWHLKNEYTRKRLEINIQGLAVEPSRALHRNLVQQMQARVVGMLGPAATEKAQREVLGWLPGR